MAVSSPAAGSPFFVTGGTLPPDAPSYVERKADRELVMAALEAIVLRSGQGSGFRVQGSEEASRVQGSAFSAGSGPVRPEPRTLNPENSPRLVIFIDEIDAVRSLPFSTDEFLAAIRECY